MRAIAILLLALGGCTVAETATVYKARQALLGASVVDLIACAGVPAHVLQTTTDELLMQWDDTVAASSGGSSLTLTAFGFTGKLGGTSGQCHFHARILRDGTVAGISFSGPALADAAAICSGMVSECLIHPDQTELPKGYDAMETFLPKAAKP